MLQKTQLNYQNNHSSKKVHEPSTCFSTRQVTTTYEVGGRAPCGEDPKPSHNIYKFGICQQKYLNGGAGLECEKTQGEQF